MKARTFVRLRALPAAALLAGVGLLKVASAATVLPLVPYNVPLPTDFSGQVTIDVSGGNASFLFETTAGNSNTSMARIYFETGLGSVLTPPPTLNPSARA